jgi:hypothetical protein
VAITRKFRYERLLKADTLTGTAKTTATDLTTTNTYYSFGANNDLWGATLSAADVNGDGFGAAFAFVGAGDVNNYTTYYLCAEHFDFAIPTGATIDGIIAECEAAYSTDGSVQSVIVDHIRITVYYTEVSGPAALQGVNGLVKASVKTVNGLAIASVKTWDGLA